MHALKNKVKSRDHLASAVVGGNIVVLGGRQPEKSELFKNLGTNELYNTEYDRWLKILFKSRLPWQQMKIIVMKCTKNSSIIFPPFKYT
jgi:hypothetical protein